MTVKYFRERPVGPGRATAVRARRLLAIWDWEGSASEITVFVQPVTQDSDVRMGVANIYGEQNSLRVKFQTQLYPVPSERLALEA
jgi:hypothetical protein